MVWHVQRRYSGEDSWMQLRKTWRVGVTLKDARRRVISRQMIHET